MLTHLSLFSGIGGIDLAAEWAGFTTVGQCEWADYPYKVLCKHWPDVPKWRDVRDVTADSVRAAGIERIDLLSGGFPCQPHSVAGKRRASDDERDLWPELARVIGELKPRWFLGENVPGLLSSEAGRFFGRVLRDLAALGYRVGWCVYGAKDVGAPHRRDRVFIVAHAGCQPGRERAKELGCLRGQLEARYACGESHGPSETWSCAVGYSKYDGCPSATESGSVAEASHDNSQRKDATGEPSGTSGRNGYCDVADTTGEGLPEWRPPGFTEGQAKTGAGMESEFERHGSVADTESKQTGRILLRQFSPDLGSSRDRARQAPTRSIESRLGGVLDGFPNWLDKHRWPAGFGEEQYDWEPPRVTTGVKHRADRLKCLGNAVVPQQVYPILKAIAEAMKHDLS